MRVAIIGAGITGATLAFELAADGHEVTVFERCSSAAAESSFATGSLLAAGQAAPWRGAGLRLLQGMLTRGGPAPVLGLGAGAPRWLWRAWRASGARTQALNRSRMLRLTQFSQSRLNELSSLLALDFERSAGVLMLLRSAKEVARSQASAKWLTEQGVDVRPVDYEQCRALEPGLSDATPLHGGLHFPDDGAGNCRQVALLLRGEAERLGARFQFGAEVARVVPGRPAELEWHHAAAPDGSRDGPAAAQLARFDAIVCCAALGAAPLLAPLGLHLPVLAVHGYSVTAPMRHHDDDARRGPRSALVDGRHQVVVTRLGHRLRATGGFEIGGDAAQHRDAALNVIYRVLNDWFPGVAQMGQAVRWKGARPMLPDGPPVLGPSGLEGLWLNLGHGSHGWAMACGSARVLADALAARAPAIDLEGLGIERLRR